MNYVPLLPDMAYGMGAGGYSSLNVLLSFFFSYLRWERGSWSIFQGKLKT